MPAPSTEPVPFERPVRAAPRPRRIRRNRRHDPTETTGPGGHAAGSSSKRHCLHVRIMQASGRISSNGNTMPPPSDPRKLGKSIIAGIAAGTVSLSGAPVIGTAVPASAQVALQSGEAALFQQAVSANNPQVVCEYLRRYPHGRLRSLLLAQSPSVLARLDPDCFDDVSHLDYRLIPESVTTYLPEAVRVSFAERGRGGGSDNRDDPYGG